MGILTNRPHTLTNFRAARMQLLSYVVGSLVVLAVIMVMPKNFPWSPLRLALALCFFGALSSLLWGLTEPLPHFLRCWVDLALEDMGDEHRTLGHLAASALGRWISFVTIPLMVAVLLAALWVTSAWPLGEPIRPWSGWLHTGIWLACFALIYILKTTTHRLKEVLTIRQAFQRQVRQSGYNVITLGNARHQEAQLSGPPVRVSGPYRFIAGGFEWSWDDFQKNCTIFGQPGSGKTVTVLNSLLEGLLSSANGQDGTEPAAALILDPKGDYRAKIVGLCRKIGREGDLIILDPEQPTISTRWNPLDTEDDAIDVSGRFAMILKLLGMQSGMDSFWIDSAKVFLEQAIGLLRATLPGSEPPSFAMIHRLASQTAAIETRLFFLHASRLLTLTDDDAFITVTDLAERVDPTGILAKIPDAGISTEPLRTYFEYWAAKSERERAAITRELISSSATMAFDPSVQLTVGSSTLLSVEYMMNNWLIIPEKTRQSVMAHLNNMLNPFLAEPYRSTFSGKSSFSLGEVLDKGKIVYVAMPAEKRSTMSPTINTLIKIEYQREVLLRLRKPRFSLFFCDEFQSFITIDKDVGDAHFFSKSRESRHANIVATPNLSGLILKVDKREMIDSLLGNCAVKMFLRNDDAATLEYASKGVFRSYTASITTVSRSGGGHGGRLGFSESVNLGESIQTLPRVSPDRLGRLTIPDYSTGLQYSEVFVNLGSRSTSNIERLLFQTNPLT